MYRLVLFAIMLEIHIIVDFHMQGILGKLKQRSEWLNHPEYSDMYKDDWAIAMWLHAFEWTFSVMLPLAYVRGWNVGNGFGLMFVINMIIHASTDHLKANLREINLVVDQLIHVTQLILTILILYV